MSAVTVRRSRRALIVALGIGQIVSWGILTYAIAVLGTPMAEELGVSRSIVFGAFSFSLLISGIVAPYTGSLIDRKGGRGILLLGALLASLALALLAFTHSLALFFAAWAVLGVSMSMSLYETSFATLSQHGGHDLRQAVTAVTLFGGFASTVFIPICLYGIEHFGWRTTVVGFAVLELIVNVPLYLFIIPHGRGDVDAAMGNSGMASPVSDARPSDTRGIALLALAFASGSFVTSAISAHVVNMLHDKGLSLEAAVWVAALIGPMQVAGRLIELSMGRHIRIITAAIIALVLLVAAVGMLGWVGGNLVRACGFVMMYGVANGVMTIARGAVPAQLFGRVGYGATMGRIAAPSFIARSLAPLAISVTFGAQSSFDLSSLTLFCAASLALLLFLLAIKRTGRAPADRA